MKRLFMVACAALAVTAAAHATWIETFESYPNGTLLDNVGGWYGWDNSPAAAGLVTNTMQYAGVNSVEISGGADAVHPFTGYTSGQWVMTAYQYIPSGMTSDTFFIINNEYNHGGPYTWAFQMQFDMTTGMVLDDNRPENTVPIVFDQWMEIRVEIDLDADTLNSFYGGAALSSGTYALLAGDPLEIANLDLFTQGTTAFYDNISLIPAPGVLAMLGLAGLVGVRRRRT